MKQRHIFLSAFLLGCGLWFGSCNNKNKKEQVIQNSTTSEAYLVTDSALYGKLGEGTGMSCIEIITNQGDTLTLNKINENNGEAGIILGGTEHYNDPLTITTDTQKENILTLVNLRTLTQKWHTVPDSITIELKNQGKLSAQWRGRNYQRWKMCNAHLLMENDNRDKTCDTFEIRELSHDSLILAHQGKILKFFSK